MRIARLALLFLMAIPASAQETDDALLEAGKSLVTENCGACHGLTADDESTHPDAPPLRVLSQNYPVATLAESLAEGILTGHPDMPVLEFEAGEVDQIIAYLESIQIE